MRVESEITLLENDIAQEQQKIADLEKELARFNPPTSEGTNSTSKGYKNPKLACETSEGHGNPKPAHEPS